MTQQYTGGNNVTTSTPDGSVPIVSKTEIEPIKTALSLMFALVTTTALTAPPPVPKPPGRAARARTAISPQAHFARRRRARRTPSPSRRTVAARGDGLRRARIACEMAARGLSLRARFVFSVEGHRRAARAAAASAPEADDLWR